ncbi:MAG TPA: class I SAM-dependent methyltransferase [Gaiellaceae bacterium]|nr:class I SAM-dependent methyltransferase [Gaiellaceae bacterium]
MPERNGDMPRLDRLRRRASILAGLAARPLEALDRAQGRRELRADEGRSAPELQPSPCWADELHALLGAPECTCPEFDSLWSGAVDTLRASTHEPGEGYDAGVTLGKAAFICARHLRPEAIVETGVARGMTSRMLLEALELNGSGHLWSIDLPPLSETWYRESRAAVPLDRRKRWTYVRGSSRRNLERVLASLPAQLSLFVHDSLHTYPTMTWEFDTAWGRLAPGGVLLSDDIDDNASFVDFAERRGVDNVVVAKEALRSGHIGVLRKPES